MTAELAADFEKRFSQGPSIRGALKLPIGEFSIAVLFGPSGCGKTTILRCLAGLERPEQGWIRFGETTWFDASRGICLPPQRRAMGYLSQDYSLFPHLTVARNIAYGVSDLDPRDRSRRIGEMISLLKLTGLEGRYSKQLSGGQQQRVALARAMVRRPRLLLLDEPLSALDTPTREALRSELRRLLAELAVPAIFVTHDRNETLALGDHVVILDNGRVCQTGSVADVFSRPADLAVARIVGVDTIQPAKIIESSDGLATIAIGKTRLIAHAAQAPLGDAYVCIQAADVILERGNATPSSARNHLEGSITGLVREGSLMRISLDCGFPLRALVTRQACEELQLRQGERVTALVKAPAIHLIPRE